MPSGPRIRTDNVFGTISDNPLTNVATTLNSAGLANLAAVSSAHAIIVIDPLRSAGAPEIVVVTAHTGAATSATITRGAYGTSARQHAQGVLWVHAPTVEDMIRIVTASTRPSDPHEGQLIYETDTDRFVGYDGSNWRTAAQLGAWSTYSPTNTNVTVGNGTEAARYMQLGKTVFWSYSLTFGSTTSIGGTVQIGLPVTARADVDACGAVACYDATGNDFTGTATSVSSGAQARPQTNNNGLTNATVPFTWATGDILVIGGTYEAA